MNCEQIENHLVSYMDGRASAADRQKVEAHLATCSACRARVEEFGRLWNVLDELPATEPSLAFDSQVRQRIAAEPRERLWSWIMPAPRFAFSLALLIALSVWISLRPTAMVESQVSAMQSDQDFRMIKDLRVLEDYDVLSNFDPLSELPQTPATPVEPKGNREM